MTSTPRTDALEERLSHIPFDGKDYSRILDHARQLERELAERPTVEEVRKWLENIMPTTAACFTINIDHPRKGLMAFVKRLREGASDPTAECPQCGAPGRLVPCRNEYVCAANHRHTWAKGRSSNKEAK